MAISKQNLEIVQLLMTKEDLDINLLLILMKITYFIFNQKYNFITFFHAN